MGLLDRFSNPVWHKAEKLDKSRQRIVAIAICFYDAVRDHVESKLVTPVEALLKSGDIAPKAFGGGLPAAMRTRLSEEALVALLRCCRYQAEGPDPLSPKMVDILREVWGAMVLADLNDKLNRSSPETLEQTGYSRDSDEARTQVLTKWMEILDVRNPSFVTQADLRGFAGAWESFAGALISGFLLGSSRIGDDQLFSKARAVSAAMPVHLAGLMQHFIVLLSSAPIEATHSAGSQTSRPTMDGTKETAGSQKGIPARVYADPSQSPDPPQELGGATEGTRYAIVGTPEAVAVVIAGLVAATFSASEFTKLFGRQGFADHWSSEDALVTWYSLGHLALVVAAWAAYNEKTKVFRALDHIRHDLLKEWNLTEGTADKLRATVNETEAEAFKSFVTSASGTDTFRFFSRYVSRILGAPVPFSAHDTFENEMMGIVYRGNDPTLITAVSDLFTETFDSLKRLLRDSSFVWDQPAPKPNVLGHSRTDPTANPKANSGVQEGEEEEDAMRRYHISSKPQPPAPPSRPEFASSGKAVLQAREGDGFIELMQQLARVFRRDLNGEDLKIATKWAENITGKPITHGVWGVEHEDAFVRAQERFFWEGNFPDGVSPEFANFKVWYRKAYPVLAGSPIAVELTDEMRALFRRTLGVAGNRGQ